MGGFIQLNIEEITDKKKKRLIAKAILADLPEWFGLSESTREYIINSQNKPFMTYLVDDEFAGFIVLNLTSEDCAEIYVMGIKKKYQRNGIGTKLVKAYEAKAKQLGCTYSQVKTVKFGCYQEYDLTNRFYQHLGYKKLECFPTLWDKWNPCQIYIKYIGK